MDVLQSPTQMQAVPSRTVDCGFLSSLSSSRNWPLQCHQVEGCSIEVPVPKPRSAARCTGPPIKHHWGEQAWSECTALLPSPPNASTGVLLEVLPRWAWLLLATGNTWPAGSVLCCASPAILMHTADKHWDLIKENGIKANKTLLPHCRRVYSGRIPDAFYWSITLANWALLMPPQSTVFTVAEQQRHHRVPLFTAGVYT